MFPAGECRAFGQRFELRGSDIAAHGRHAAIRAGDEVSRRHVFNRRLDNAGYFFQRFDLVAGYINDARSKHPCPQGA